MFAPSGSQQATSTAAAPTAASTSASTDESSTSIRAADDFERGSSHEYVLGAGSDVVNRAVNDPRKQVLQTEDVESFPVYVRFEPNNSGDNWNLARAELSFNNDFFPRWETTTFISEADGIWLGKRSGNVVHLRKHRTRRQAKASTRAGPPGQAPAGGTSSAAQAAPSA